MLWSVARCGVEEKDTRTISQTPLAYTQGFAILETLLTLGYTALIVIAYLLSKDIINTNDFF